MTTFGAFTIISSRVNTHKVLLIKRRDYPLWDLPGGQVERDEKPEHAAVREAWEESGFEVEIKHISGIYHNAEVDDFQFIYLGKITGGSSLEFGDETAAVKFFHIDKLPFLMIPHRKMQIKMAFTGLSNETPIEIHDSFLIQHLRHKKSDLTILSNHFFYVKCTPLST